MEEWIGQQWHRLVTRWAEPGHAAAAVSLDEMRKPLGLLLRCGGGPAGMRIGPAAARSHGGPRGWAQRVAGGGTRAALPELHGDLLALPPTVAVFADKALNRSLYLWLAALASQWGTVAAHHGDSWLSHNVAAARATLATFPGLATAYAQLRQAQLALRPSPGALRGPAAEAEAWVQRALRGEWDHGFPKDVAWPKGLTPTNVAPVWLWLEGCDTTTADAPRRQAQSPGDRSANDAAPLAPEDRTRRKAERVRDERHAAPLMLFFRAESILSWGEFTKVQRADDDSDDGNALEAARDMDVLSIAEDPGNANRLAARVRFDLDLPSAAADDVVLGPGEHLPEWDWKAGVLRPAHCAVQCRVARETTPFTPDAQLRTTVRQVRRRLEVLRAAPLRAHAQADGDELDVDAWVRHAADAAAWRSESPAVWQRRVRAERSLATLLLADLSLSTDAHVAGAGRPMRVVDVIRDALYVFGEALTAGGDTFEMLGFSSVRRQNVRIQHLKGFDEAWTGAARARVGAIKPGYYTRMGAAIRHATARLAARPERQRLLLLLTDGKPNDLDVYEGRYGLEDTRHAVQEARAQGLTPFAVTIDDAGHDYLPYLFGQQGYALVHRPRDLAQRLAAVYSQLTRQQ
jgi:nitric oxide reductase NorD protein